MRKGQLRILKILSNLSFEKRNKIKYEKIEFASQISIEQYEDIASDFCKRILDLDYKDVIISDESRISDFASLDEDWDAQKFIDKAAEVYQIDTSDLDDIYLVEFFQRISILK